MRLIILFVGILFTAATFSSDSQKTIELSWVIAHEPSDYFEQTARLLDLELRTKTQGRLGLKIVSTNNLKSHQRQQLSDQALSRVLNGENDIAQIYTGVLGKKVHRDFYVFDVPFLFKDHDHVARVVDGTIGQELLAKVEHENLKGLGFTYSGGYMVIPTKNVVIKSHSDMKGMKFRTYLDPSSEEFAKFSGVETVYPDFQIDGRYMGLTDYFEHGLVDGGIKTFVDVEATMEKKYSKKENAPMVINDLRHRIYLTTLVINKKKYESLPKDLQQILSEEAHKISTSERKLIVESVQKIRQKYRDSNEIKLNTLTERERAAFKSELAPVYQKLKMRLNGELIDQIEVLSTQKNKISHR